MESAGKRALKQLKQYYEGNGDSRRGKNGSVCSCFFSYIFNHLQELKRFDDDEVDLLKENITPRKTAPTLLKRLTV
jgi:hypothetical protein